MTDSYMKIDEHRVMVVMPEAMFGQVKARAVGNGRCVGREVCKMVEGVLVREAKRRREARSVEERKVAAFMAAAKAGKGEEE